MINKIDREKMLKVGKMVSHILDEVGKIIVADITTEDIDRYGVKLIESYGAKSAALGYRGFKKSLCTSVNDVICHGIPSENVKLKNGDFINVDIAIEYDGHYGDTSRCFIIGKIPDKTKDLINSTYEAMWLAIEKCGPGVKINQIGKTIENYIKPKGYGIVRDFCGHGIGNKMHMEPEIPHYFDSKISDILTEGMCITIEPMINGSKNINCRILNDGWTAKTLDGSMSAQWEHTIYISENGYEVMTFNSYDEAKGKKQKNITQFYQY